MKNCDDALAHNHVAADVDTNGNDFCVGSTTLLWDGDVAGI